MSEEKKTEESKSEFMIRLQWGATDDIQTLYASHMIVTHAGNEFYIIFGESPPLFDLSPDNIPEFLEVKPIVKIAVTPENMKRFAAAIQENMEMYYRREKGSKE